MDKSLSQSLHGLIPTFPPPLPAQLLELATSLLAQSRIQARSLKADEEIARSYACAHLACERLKISLSLPKIQPRPPCPPRVYQKLYRYLDSALLAGSPRRSSRTNNNFTKNKDAITAPSSSTPSKSRTPAQQSNASAGKLKRPLLRCAAVPAENGNKEDLVPQWVMPAIRVLCGKLGAPAAPPHVYAGVSSILTLPAPSKRIDECSSDGGEQVNIAAGQAKNQPTRTMKKIPALIVAVSLIVYTCLSGKSTPPAEYARQKTIGLAALRGVVPPALLATRGSAQSEHNDSNDGCNTPADVDGWLREIRDGGWTQLDWFKNVGQGTGLKVGEGGEDEEDPHGDENHEHEENSWTLRKGLEDDGEEQEYLQPGLGTMMQDKLDYLSERRQLQYQTWKRGMIVKIEEMERERQMNVSDGSER